jgi:hypothetical protein
MNRQQLQTALATATRSTFEELGLLLASEEPGQGAGQLAAGARVHFDGPWSGSVVLRVSDDVLDAAAANMLGHDAPPAEPLRRDALGELANVLCGNLLPMVAGPKAVFQLRSPRWLGADADDDHRARTRVAATLDVESGCAEVTICLPPELVDDTAA